MRGTDSESEVAYSSGRLEGSGSSNFGSFRVTSVLTLKDLEIIKLKYQVPTEFRQEVVILGERIALPHQGRVGLYKKFLKAGLSKQLIL